MVSRPLASVFWISCAFQNALALKHLKLALRPSSTLATALTTRKRPRNKNTHTINTPISFIHHQIIQTHTPSSLSAKKTLIPPPNQFYQSEEIVKKSRFIGIATPCSTWTEAQTYLEQVRKDHAKARHVCFGFVGGGDSDGDVGTERCSDDGEPTGTAGVPILGAIKGEELSDTLCIVVRYFGGIKLGAGGLIRAYGSAARLVLRSSNTAIYIPKSTIRLSTRTANSGAIYSCAAKFGGVTSGERYNDRGELEVCVVCDEVDRERLMEEMSDATRGGVMFF